MFLVFSDTMVFSMVVKYLKYPQFFSSNKIDMGGGIFKKSGEIFVAPQ